MPAGRANNSSNSETTLVDGIHAQPTTTNHPLFIVMTKKKMPKVISPHRHFTNMSKNDQSAGYMDVLTLAGCFVQLDVGISNSKTLTDISINLVFTSLSLVLRPEHSVYIQDHSIQQCYK